MIKIITQNVYGGRGQWGYSLRVNGKFVRMSSNGLTMANSKEGATIWANVAAIRDIWAKYMPTIIYLS